MPLMKWAGQNVIDPLTSGSHSLLRDATKALVESPTSYDSLSGVEMSEAVPLQNYLRIALEDKSALQNALDTLNAITDEKAQIDMTALLQSPHELFMAETEWVNAEVSARQEKERQRFATGAAEADDPMEILRETIADQERVSPNSNSAVEQAPEQAEIIQHALSIGAKFLLKLDERIRQNEEQVPMDTDDTNADTEEDPLIRRLRMNLLAVAKRAPIDKIAHLPADLVPAHIRHIVPTLPP